MTTPALALAHNEAPPQTLAQAQVMSLPQAAGYVVQPTATGAQSSFMHPGSPLQSAET